ncbi:18137_t:CDS:2, partial [Gigaspora rosea]
QLIGYKDKLSAQTLISQIIKFRENQFPYKIGYDSQLMTPFMWWSFVEDKFDNLKILAKKIFAITPHSASLVVLVVNDIVDLNHQMFNQADNQISNEENNNLDIAMNDDHEFNLEKLIHDQDFE